MGDALTTEWQRLSYSDDLRGPLARANFGKYVVGEGPASLAAQHAVGQNYTNMMAATERELSLSPT
jgi:hypothetical protein